MNLQHTTDMDQRLFLYSEVIRFDGSTYEERFYFKILSVEFYGSILESVTISVIPFIGEFLNGGANFSFKTSVKGKIPQSIQLAATFYQQEKIRQKNK